MMTMKIMISNKEMMTILTSVSSSVTTTKMKTMISNKERMTIETTVSSSETMMALKTMISNRQMITIMTIAGTHDTMVAIYWMTGYQTVDTQVLRICFIISWLRPINAFIDGSNNEAPFQLPRVPSTHNRSSKLATSLFWEHKLVPTEKRSQLSDDIFGLTSA